MPTIATPSPVNSSSFNVTWEGQPASDPYPYEQGYVHLIVTPPSGQKFSSNFIANFSAVLWSLSDDCGRILDQQSRWRRS